MSINGHKTQAYNSREHSSDCRASFFFNKLSAVGALFSNANQAKKRHLGSVLACQILEELKPGLTNSAHFAENSSKFDGFGQTQIQKSPNLLFRNSKKSGKNM
jgi:hypothetical protein